MKIVITQPSAGVSIIFDKLSQVSVSPSITVNNIGHIKIHSESSRVNNTGQDAVAVVMNIPSLRTRSLRDEKFSKELEGGLVNLWASVCIQVDDKDYELLVHHTVVEYETFLLIDNRLQVATYLVTYANAIAEALATPASGPQARVNIDDILEKIDPPEYLSKEL